MQKQYVIQLTFYNGTDEKSVYWLQGFFCFTFSRPFAGIEYKDLAEEVNNATQHARQVLGLRAFHVYAHVLKPDVSSTHCWYCALAGRLCEFHLEQRKKNGGQHAY